jgi:hypothetical protein
MNVEIGTEAAQFLFWAYINGIFFIVCQTKVVLPSCRTLMVCFLRKNYFVSSTKIIPTENPIRSLKITRSLSHWSMFHLSIG